MNRKIKDFFNSFCEPEQSLTDRSTKQKIKANDFATQEKNLILVRTLYESVALTERKKRKQKESKRERSKVKREIQ